MKKVGLGLELDSHIVYNHHPTVWGWGGGGNRIKEIGVILQKSAVPMRNHWRSTHAYYIPVAGYLHAPTLWNPKKPPFFLWTVAINDDILFRRCMIKVILIMNINEIKWRVELYGIATLQHFARNTVDRRANWSLN